MPGGYPAGYRYRRYITKSDIRPTCSRLWISKDKKKILGCSIRRIKHILEEYRYSLNSPDRSDYQSAVHLSPRAKFTLNPPGCEIPGVQPQWAAARQQNPAPHDDAPPLRTGINLFSGIRGSVDSVPDSTFHFDKSGSFFCYQVLYF